MPCFSGINHDRGVPHEDMECKRVPRLSGVNMSSNKLGLARDKVLEPVNYMHISLLV